MTRPSAPPPVQTHGMARMAKLPTTGAVPLNRSWPVDTDMNRDELADGLVHEWADWWTTEDVEKIDADNGEYLDKLIKRSVAYAETARLSPPVAAPDGLRRLVNAVKAVVDRHA